MALQENISCKNPPDDFHEDFHRIDQAEMGDLVIVWEIGQIPLMKPFLSYVLNVSPKYLKTTRNKNTPLFQFDEKIVTKKQLQHTLLHFKKDTLISFCRDVFQTQSAFREHQKDQFEWQLESIS